MKSRHHRVALPLQAPERALPAPSLRHPQPADAAPPPLWPPCPCLLCLQVCVSPSRDLQIRTWSLDQGPQCLLLAGRICKSPVSRVASSGTGGWDLSTAFRGITPGRPILTRLVLGHPGNGRVPRSFPGAWAQPRPLVSTTPVPARVGHCGQARPWAGYLLGFGQPRPRALSVALEWTSCPSPKVDARVTPSQARSTAQASCIEGRPLPGLRPHQPQARSSRPVASAARPRPQGTV